MRTLPSAAMSCSSFAREEVSGLPPATKIRKGMNDLIARAPEPQWWQPLDVRTRNHGVEQRKDVAVAPTKAVPRKATVAQQVNGAFEAHLAPQTRYERQQCLRLLKGLASGERHPIHLIERQTPDPVE